MSIELQLQLLPRGIVFCPSSIITLVQALSSHLYKPPSSHLYKPPLPCLHEAPLLYLHEAPRLRP